MKTNLKNDNNNYTAARAKWAQENSELFLNTLEKVGIRMGVKITPIQYVKAYKLCIEEFKFGYPAEYKIAEIISTDETYEQILTIMINMMKSFRQEYYKTRKKKKERRKRAA